MSPAQPWKWRSRDISAKERRFIYERDAWQCAICEEDVDPELTHPHPLSATIHHLVDRCLGGGDERANLRCAHRTCNASGGGAALAALEGSQVRVVSKAELARLKAQDLARYEHALKCGDIKDGRYLPYAERPGLSPERRAQILVAQARHLARPQAERNAVVEAARERRRRRAIGDATSR